MEKKIGQENLDELLRKLKDLHKKMFEDGEVIQKKDEAVKSPKKDAKKDKTLRKERKKK